MLGNSNEPNLDKQLSVHWQYHEDQSPKVDEDGSSDHRKKKKKKKKNLPGGCNWHLGRFQNHAMQSGAPDSVSVCFIL